MKHICGFVAVPTSTTLFATTNSGDCATFSSSADHLWRSDDAGAHWRDLGPLGSWISILAVAEQGPYDAQPTLYVLTVSKSSSYDLRLEVSTDGGYTWQTAPTAGFPAGYTPYLQIGGTLSDGSVVMILTSSWQAGPQAAVTLAMYTWHAGDSEWHEVAPNVPHAYNGTLTNGEDQFLVTPTGGVHGTIWRIQRVPAPPTSSSSVVTRYSS